MARQTKSRSVTCYNLIIPTWLLLSPWGLPILGILGGGVFIFILLVGNYAIDFAVAALGMRLAHAEGVRKRVWAVSVRVWLLGYAADLLGCLPLIAVIKAQPDNDWWYRNLEWPICYGNPLSTPPAMLLIGLCLLLTAGLIYFFNMRWGLNKANLEPAQKRRVALTLAVLTAPYFFLLPAPY